MSYRCFTFAAALLATGTGGYAACPTRADLDEGVVLVQNTPFFARSDFETAGSSVFFASEFRHPDGSITTQSGFLAEGMLSREMTNDGVVTRFEVEGDPALLAHLDQIGEMTFTGTMQEDGQAPLPFAETYRFIAESHLDLAECRYVTWEIDKEQHIGADISFHWRMSYAPALGMPLAVFAVTPEGSTPILTYQWAGTASDVRR